jgi:hypothetical protein
MASVDCGSFDMPSMEDMDLSLVGTAGFRAARSSSSRSLGLGRPPALAITPTMGGGSDWEGFSPQSVTPPAVSMTLGSVLHFDDDDDDGDSTPLPLQIVDLSPEALESNSADAAFLSDPNLQIYQIDPNILPRAPPPREKGQRRFSRSKHPVLRWSKETFPSSEKLVDYVDAGERLSNMLQPLKLSVTVADPFQPGCPLVAASAGFCALTGYQQSEILGRNCGFLHRGVPEDMLCQSTKNQIREFIALCKQSRQPPREAHHFSQVNARVDGTLFTSQFLLAATTLCTHTFILGLQVDAEKFSHDRSLCEEYLRNTLQQLRGFFHMRDIHMPKSFDELSRPKVRCSRRSRSNPVSSRRHLGAVDEEAETESVAPPALPRVARLADMRKINRSTK